MKRTGAALEKVRFTLSYAPLEQLNIRICLTIQITHDVTLSQTVSFCYRYCEELYVTGIYSLFLAVLVIFFVQSI